jgi:hypothetical protein
MNNISAAEVSNIILSFYLGQNIGQKDKKDSVGETI